MSGPNITRTQSPVLAIWFQNSSVLRYFEKLIKIQWRETLVSVVKSQGNTITVHSCSTDVRNQHWSTCSWGVSHVRHMAILIWYFSSSQSARQERHFLLHLFPLSDKKLGRVCFWVASSPCNTWSLPFCRISDVFVDKTPSGPHQWQSRASSLV